MPRIPDVLRVQRLLQSEGGSLGRREIIEQLGLSDTRYQELAAELVAKKAVLKNRGRAGGLRLVDLATVVQINGEAAKPNKPAREADLYAPFARYLERAAKEGDESRSVVLKTHDTKMGKWETPDLTEVRVTPFPMIGQWELKVATYELKRQGAWSVDSVLQTATYGEFAHESWLVVPSADTDDWVEHFGNRVVDKAGDFGIGLATFDEGAGTLKKHMKPRSKVPVLSRMHEWLESVIERLSNSRARTEIGNNVRWARGKAEAGRD